MMIYIHTSLERQVYFKTKDNKRVLQETLINGSDVGYLEEVAVSVPC